MYDRFAKDAEAEGFRELAARFRKIGEIKNPMKRVTVICSVILKCKSFLKKATRSCGNAAFADILKLAKKLRIFAYFEARKENYQFN